MCALAAELLFRGQEAAVVEGVAEVTGEVPAGLRGTFWRVGPGWQRVGPDELAFPDGHGMVGAATFQGGRVTFRAAHVRTPSFEAERQAGRQLYRRAFTNLPARWKNLGNMRLANLANHDVFSWGGKVCCTAVGGSHWFEVAAGPLATVGPCSPADGGDQLAPMPRVDPHRGRLVTYSVKTGGLRADRLCFRELDRNWQTVHSVAGSLAASAVQVHDLAFTDRWLLALASPQEPDLPALLWGRTPVFEAMRFREGRRPRLVLGERRPGAHGLEIVDLPEPLCHAFHIVNAWDDSDTDGAHHPGQLTLDVLATSQPPHFAGSYPPALRRRHRLADLPYPATHLYRLHIDPQAGWARAERLLPLNLEFPTLAPAELGRRHRRAWFGLGRGGTAVEHSLMIGGLVAFDLNAQNTPPKIWRPEAESMLSQPAFVPDGAGGGWLLAYLVDVATTRTRLVVLDALAIDRGPLAEVTLAPFLPPTSHCRFAPAAG